MRGLKGITTSLLLMAGAAMTAHGEYVQRNTPQAWTDWNGSVAGWFSESSVARLPAADDWVRIHYNRDTYLTNSAVSIAKLDMYFLGGADLRIDNGGSLLVTTNGTTTGYNGAITLSAAGSGAGIPNLGTISVESGGSLTSGNTGGRTVLTGDATQRGSLNLNGGTFTAQGSVNTDGLVLVNSEININSGVFDMTGGQTQPSNVDFNINGDGADINFTYLNVLASSFSATFNYTLAPTGVSTVNIANWVHLSGASLAVDASNYAYAGGDTNITLINAGSLASTIDPANITVSGFPWWATTTIVQDTTNTQDVILHVSGTPSVEPPPPVIWELDMTVDPVLTNWTDRTGSSAYSLTASNTMVTTGTTLLDSEPFNLFKDVTKVDLVWKSTAAAAESALGAGLWVNVSGDAPDYGAINFHSVLLSNNTQTVKIYGNYNSQLLASLSGFGPGWLTLSAEINSELKTITYQVTDGVLTNSDTVAYTPLKIANDLDKGATLFDLGVGGAEFDYVRVEANARPEHAFMFATDDPLILDLNPPATVSTNSTDLVYGSSSNIDITAINISGAMHAGWSVLTSAPQTLPGASGWSVPLKVVFDSAVEGVSGISTCLVTVVWTEQGSGVMNNLDVAVRAQPSITPGTLNLWTGNAGTTSFGNDANWSLGVAPGTLGEDRALIQHGGTVDVAVATSGSFNHDLEVKSNTGMSVLNISADMPNLKNLKAGPEIGWTGTINQSAGSVSMTEALTVGPGSTVALSGGIMTVDSDNNNPNVAMITVSGTLEISGGTLNQLNGRVAGAGTFRIMGDGATVNIFQIWAGFTGTLDFVLDETGVSGISNGSWGHLNTISGLTVDGSAYVGNTNSIVLYSGLRNNGPLGSNYTVTGLGTEGVDWEIVEENGSGAFDNSTIQTVTLNILTSHVPAGFGFWVSTFGLTGPDADWDYDYDGDNAVNLSEYAFGGDPTNALNSGFPAESSIIEAGGTNFMEYVYPRRKDYRGVLDYTPEFGSNLVFTNWNGSGVVELPVTGEINAEYESVTNRVDITGKPVGFMQTVVDEL